MYVIILKVIESNLITINWTFNHTFVVFCPLFAWLTYFTYMYTSITVIMISRLFLNLREEGRKLRYSPDDKDADMLSWSVMNIGKEGERSIEMDER